MPLKSQNKVFGVIVVQSYINEKAYNKNDVQLLQFVANQISGAILRKNTDFELKKALAKAQESDRLKSAFLANMSHEIRTPMNGILGFTDLLKQPELTGEKQKKYIEVIEKSDTVGGLAKTLSWNKFLTEIDSEFFKQNFYLNEDEKFFKFYRSMLAYENTFSDDGTTMLLSPDSDFFSYFGNKSGK